MTDQTLKDIDRAFKALKERDELLNKIREEIRDLRYSGGIPTAEICGYIKCLEIIDKYKEESEET